MTATACAHPVSPPYAPVLPGRCGMPFTSPRISSYDALPDTTLPSPNRGSAGR